MTNVLKNVYDKLVSPKTITFKRSLEDVFMQYTRNASRCISEYTHVRGMLSGHKTNILNLKNDCKIIFN